MLTQKGRILFSRPLLCSLRKLPTFCDVTIGFPANSPRSMYLNSNMTQRLWDKIVNFSRPHCLAIPRRDEHRENQTKYRKMTRKSRSHVRILIWQTWAIDVWGTNVEIPYWWRVTTQIWVTYIHILLARPHRAFQSQCYNKHFEHRKLKTRKIIN